MADECAARISQAGLWPPRCFLVVLPLLLSGTTAGSIIVAEWLRWRRLLSILLLLLLLVGLSDREASLIYCKRIVRALAALPIPPSQPFDQ
jgi:hypothetical protein